MSSGDTLPADVVSAALAALPKKKKVPKTPIAKDAGKTKKSKKRNARSRRNPALPTPTVLPPDPTAPAPVATPIVKFLNEHRFGPRLLRDPTRSLKPRKLRRPIASR